MITTRPNLQVENDQEGRRVETKRINGDLFSGFITDVDEEMMNSDKDRLDIDIILIYYNGGLNDEGARSTWYLSTGIGTADHDQVTPDKIWACDSEESLAYHVGGQGVNQSSIGIQHLNGKGESDWTIAEEIYAKSARLIAAICQHIVQLSIVRQSTLIRNLQGQTALEGLMADD